MSALIDSVRSGFALRFTTDDHSGPVGVWRAPGRVNLIGEHTDYNEGFVLPLAIDKDTVVALAPRRDRMLRVASSFSPDTVEITLDDLTPDALSGWAAYPLGVAWALRETLPDAQTVTGWDAYIESEVPVGAGLSSSAAIECAVAVALNEIWSLGLDAAALARVGQRAENQVVGAPTGIMDQSASMLGQLDSVVLLDCRSLEASVEPLGLDAAGLSLLVIDTRVAHSHATGGYTSRRASCEKGASALGVPALRDLTVDDLARAEGILDDETFRRVRHIVTENQRVLDTVHTLRESGPAAIGELLLASHRSMRDDFEISTPELDRAVSAAHAAGAIGARMTGGGFGGSAIALASSTIVDEVSAAVTAAFSADGFQKPEIFVVRAASGASRVTSFLDSL